MDAKLEAGLGLGGTGGCCICRKSDSSTQDCPDRKKKNKGSDSSFMCFSLTWTDTRRWLVWKQGEMEVLLPGLVKLGMSMRTGMNFRQGAGGHKTPYTTVPIPQREQQLQREVKERLLWKWAGEMTGGCFG